MTTYKEAGVDIDAGNEAVRRIKKMAEGTFTYVRGNVLSGIGAFAAAVERPSGEIFGFAIDGVGSKLLIAALLDRHETVGIDLVAMSANDLIVGGFRPWIFLDYIAMGKQIPERTEQIIVGITEGCRQAGMALVGGEMAEMPGMYEEKHYDLAGFAVGFAQSRAELITGENIRPGMHVYGIPSSGVHSNGFGLIRRAFGLAEERRYKRQRMILDAYHPEIAGMLGEELLKPTVIYVQHIGELRRRYEIAGMAHITGGGLVENPPRILPDGCAIVIDKDAWEVPSIFRFIQRKGEVPEDEMFRVFNMGIGLVAVSPDRINESGVIPIGEVIESAEKKVFFK